MKALQLVFWVLAASLIAGGAAAECLGTMDGRITSCDNGPTTGFPPPPKKRPISGTTTYAEPSNTSTSQDGRQLNQAVESLGNYLQQRDDEKKQQEQYQQYETERLEAEAKAQNAKGVEAFNAVVDGLENTDWETQARQAKGEYDCDCSNVIARCSAKIDSLKRTGKTGASFRVSSSEPFCSKVSYYIDGKPNLTVLSKRSFAIDQVSGLKTISIQQFEVERCEVCAKK